MGDGGLESLGLDELAGLDNLLVTFGTKRNVDPAGELVLKIPCRLAVSHEDKSALVGSLGGGEAASAEWDQDTISNKGSIKKTHKKTNICNRL